MSQEKIEKLTPEQEALIPVYREKWRKIALSTEPIDKEKAAEAVKAVYDLIDWQQPEFIFCCSPYNALKTIFNLPYNKNILTEEAYSFCKCFFDKYSDEWKKQPEILDYTNVIKLLDLSERIPYYEIMQDDLRETFIDI